jgi:hypothetical protein
MARKRLTKGANALRVEERIARVPLDMVRPVEGETGIFKALKALEDDAVPAEEAPRPRPSAAPRRRPAKGAARPAALGARIESEGRLGPDSFSEAERRAIVLSCTEYRNRLPTYLRSARREVEIIDSILRKCARAESLPPAPD